MLNLVLMPVKRSEMSPKTPISILECFWEMWNSLRNEDCSVKRSSWFMTMLVCILEQLIQTLLKDFYWEQLGHHPYSMNLVPTDCCLFPQFKKELGGQHFHTREELFSVVTNICIKLGEDFYHEVVKKLITRCNKCLDRHGDYIENRLYLKLHNRIFSYFLASFFDLKKIDVVTSGVPLVCKPSSSGHYITLLS